MVIGRKLSVVQSGCSIAAAVLTFLFCSIVGNLNTAQAALNQWQNINLGDTQDNGWALNFGDVNGDGWPDAVGNRIVFINPGSGDVTSGWQTKQVPGGHKGYFLYDVDRDGLADIIANTLTNLYYLHTNDASVSGFTSHTVATNIVPDHNTFEGYIMADLVKGGNGHLEVVVAYLNKNWVMYRIPDNPEGTWPSVRIVANGEDEGIGVGDVDGDDELDVAGGQDVLWWKNPGDGSGDWQGHRVGDVTGKGVDRCRIADLDGDGDQDIFTVCDAENNNVAWFENPGDPTSTNWTTHTIERVNGQGHGGAVGDLDCDCDIDLIAGTTTGAFETKVYENDGQGNFTTFKVPENGDLHNTGRIIDIDNDGDLDILGIGWLNHNLRIWRNDNEQVDPCGCCKDIQPEGECEPDAARRAAEPRFEFGWNGPHKLRLLDSRGRTVDLRMSESGRIIDSSTFSGTSGVYYLVAERDGILRKKRVAIVR